MGKGVYRIINKIIDIKTGFSLGEATRNAIAFDRLSREEITAYHEKAFLKLRDHAIHAKYYESFKDASLGDFPLMNRATYSMQQDNLLTHVSPAYATRKSSGSTGYPVSHHITKEMLLAKRASHQRMLARFGLERESSELKMGGYKVGAKIHLYYLLRNKRYYSSDHIAEKGINKVLKGYNRFKPEVLYGYPSAILDFLRRAQVLEFPIHIPKIVCFHAEVLTDHVVGAVKETLPGAQIVNQYWSTEANIGATCPHGNIHMDEDTVICELHNIDEEGFGDLYITNVFSFALPIIRYKIGDRVKISDQPCSCGRMSRVIETIQGRDMEMIELPDGSFTPITVLHINWAAETENILSFQFLYSQKNSDIVMRYVPMDKKKPIEEDLIRKSMEKLFKLKVKFERVDFLEMSESGKTPQIIFTDSKSR